MRAHIHDIVKRLETLYRIRFWLGENRRAGARLPRRGLHLESLEDRLAPAVFNVNSLADVLKPPTGVVTLRSAIRAANATAGSNTINLSVAGTYKITIPGTGENRNATGDFDIIPNSASPAGSTLTIQNTSGGPVTVDGNKLDRVFDINPAAAAVPAGFTVIFGGPQASQGFTITGGVTPSVDFNIGSGGGIESQGNVNVTLNNMVVSGNSAYDGGGGVGMWEFSNTVWTLTLTNSTISNNYSNDGGGGVFSNGKGKILITGSLISGNVAYNRGGGVFLDSIGIDTADLTIDHTLLSNNTASHLFGGGVGNDGNGTVSITNSTVRNNSSVRGGGYGDRQGSASLSILGSLFLNNAATSNGGGIAAGGPATSITNSEIEGNSSTAGSGGGLFANGAKLTIQSSSFVNNKANGSGGGIELATTGAGLNPSGITDVTVAGNTAGSKGGGIDAGSAFTGDLNLINDTISANSATNGGGVFWAGVSSSHFRAQNTILARNSAGTGPDATNTANSFSDQGGNLIGIAGSGSGNTGFTATTSQRGTTLSPLNPLLGSLQNNGGPAVGSPGTAVTLKTVAPLSGSPAIGNGILTGAPATDELGFPSVINGRINVGAVSVGAAGTATIIGQPVQALEGQAFNGAVATLQLAGAALNTLAGSIDWGDQTSTTAATISGSNGTFTISGQHSYVEDGQYKITVTATQSGANIGSGNTLADVAENDLSVRAVSVSGIEGQPFSGVVATFTDPGAAAIDTFTATIYWGDSTSSAGTVSGSNGSYTVSGSHVYVDEGSFPTRITVTENGVSQQAPTPAGTSTAIIAEGDILAGKISTTLTATAGLAFSGSIATFTDSYTGSSAKDFTASIVWGDATSSPGTVSGANGSFTVSGTHTYSSVGSFNLKVTITEQAPGSATATATGSIEVSNVAPRPAIQSVLNMLPGMKAAAATSSETNMLGDVIDKLTPALWSSSWVDDYHLQPNGGATVFDSLNNAETELYGMYVNPGTVPKDQLLSILNKLAQAAEQLVSIAINDATARSGNAAQLALANQELANGLNDLNAGNFGTVIGHFKNAWQDAISA